jgi:hypothetical protein
LRAAPPTATLPRRAGQRSIIPGPRSALGMLPHSARSRLATGRRFAAICDSGSAGSGNLRPLLPTVGLLTPILDEGAQSRLGQQAPPRNPAGVPRRDGMRLLRSQDAPVKAVCSARESVSDDPARLAFRIDEQLGARADATPLRCRIRRPALAAAQFTGKSPEVFGVVLWHTERHPPQPGGLWGSGGRPSVTHQLAPRRFFVDQAPCRSSRRLAAWAAKRSAVAMSEATEESGKVATNSP